MKYISIDIETTGLNPERHHILEFAAVIADTEKNIPAEEFPSFKRLILRTNLTGEPYALVMNHEILKEISECIENAKRGEQITRDIVHESNLESAFKQFLIENQIFEGYGDYKTKINVAGKNFANFDKLFIDKLFRLNYSSRFLDPAILYAEKTDKRLPDLKTCLERAGIEKSVSHRALDDALDVVRLIQKKFNGE